MPMRFGKTLGMCGQRCLPGALVQLSLPVSLETTRQGGNPSLPTGMELPLRGSDETQKSGAFGTGTETGLQCLRSVHSSGKVILLPNLQPEREKEGRKGEAGALVD